MLQILDDLSPERTQALEDGQELNAHEVTVLADAVAVECFQADGENDAWAVSQIQSTDGSTAFVASTIAGCSWEGIERTFIGVFPSLEGARERLKRLGYLDGEDFRRRYQT